MILSDFDINIFWGVEIEFYVIGVDPGISAKILNKYSKNKIVEEWGEGQFEIKSDIFIDIDKLYVWASEAVAEIGEIVSRIGGTVSFECFPHMGQPPSSMHLSVSLFHNNNNILVDEYGNLSKSSELLKRIIFGLIKSYKNRDRNFCYIKFLRDELNDKSYSRIFLNNDISWGINNRAVAFRVVYSKKDPKNTRVENRTLCPKANLRIECEKMLLSIYDGLSCEHYTDIQPVYGRSW